jgi:hypothetical protein
MVGQPKSIEPDETNDLNPPAADQTGSTDKLGHLPQPVGQMTQN